MSIKVYDSLFLVALIILGSCNSKHLNDEVRTDFCSNIHRNDSISLQGEIAPLLDSMRSKTGVYVLEDGGGSLVARAWFTEYAEKTIDIQYFIFSTDNIGLIACDYLVRAADRGVKVRIIVDDIMVEAGVHDILTIDAHPNIEIKIYNPGVNLGRNLYSKLKKFATDFRSANQRMHNKTFIVDGNLVITGGRNIADEYFDYNAEYNFRDRDVLLLGKSVKTVSNSFEEFWGSELSMPVSEVVDQSEIVTNQNNLYNKLHEYACNPDNFWPEIRNQIDHLTEAFHSIRESGKLIWVDSVKFVSDIPGKNDGSEGLKGGGITTNELIQLVKGAKISVDIQSPYLIAGDEGIKLFKDAADRGVKIRIMTNSLASTDNVEAFSGYQREREKLLNAGVRIFEFKPDAAERYRIMTGALQKEIDYAPIFGLHAKSMVVDGEIAVIGTFNLDPRSANLNTECFAVIHSNPIAQGVLQGMEEEFKPENSWETTREHNPDSVAGVGKSIKTWTRKIIPKSIL